MMFFDDEPEINFLIEQKKKGKHRTISGGHVNYFSERCRADLQKRIADAIHCRDHETHRTDARSYYNGILKVLRRKMREVSKELDKDADQKPVTEVARLTQSNCKSFDDVTYVQRILKLSGVI